MTHFGIYSKIIARLIISCAVMIFKYYQKHVFTATPVVRHSRTQSKREDLMQWSEWLLPSNRSNPVSGNTLRCCEYWLDHESEPLHSQQIRHAVFTHSANAVVNCFQWGTTTTTSTTNIVPWLFHLLMQLLPIVQEKCSKSQSTPHHLHHGQHQESE